MASLISAYTRRFQQGFPSGVSDLPEATAYNQGVEALDQQWADALGVAELDPANLAAEDAYQACLANRGYADYEAYTLLIADYSEQANVSPDEVALKMIDIDCDVESQRTVTRSRLVQDAHNDFITSHDAEINQVLTLKQAYLEASTKRADEIDNGTVTVPSEP